MFNKKEVTTFSELKLLPVALQTLDSKQWILPTPIQAKAIPLAMEGHDVIGIAQTGTGKTLAFGLPIIQKLSETPGIALILVPTRELAEQVAETMGVICKPLKIPGTFIIGGVSMGNQIRALKHNPRVIIATPGRLIDHLQQGTIELFDVKMLVLDEADRMLDMGFAPQIEMILKTVPSERQTMLFSATMPTEIKKITSKYMRKPHTIEVAPAGTAAELVEQSVYMVDRPQKRALLVHLLDENKGPIIVFVRTKRIAQILTTYLSKNFTVAEIHSDRSQAQRRSAIEGFKAGKYRILIATDIAARGIDVKNIELVINYDLPDDTDSYIHRIGRTGRAGRKGLAVSFATPDQSRLLWAIERLIKKPILKVPVPKDLPKPEATDHHYADKPVSSRFRPRSSARNTDNSFGTPRRTSSTGGGYHRRSEGNSEGGDAPRPYRPKGGSGSGESRSRSYGERSSYSPKRSSSGPRPARKPGFRKLED